MTRLFLLLFVLACGPVGAALSQEPDTLEQYYRVYTASGEAATLADVVAAMAGVEVVLVGETHDDPTTHALEARLLEEAFAHYGATRPVAVSLEMFERDVQGIVDEYLAGLITEDHFRRSSRPWNNYETDYRPLVEFAREQELPVLAANPPRRYVNRVSRLGPEALQALPEQARAMLAPLPYALASPAYRAKWDKAMSPPTPVPDTTAAGTAEADTAAVSPGPSMHGNMEYILASQSLWDATMAYSIVEHLTRVPEALVLHMVGSFHIEAGTGIPEHLVRYRPGARQLIVLIRPHDDIAAFDVDAFAGLGDYVILTDKALPRTF
jgi:uncharacterized iron-regulated protein